MAHDIIISTAVYLLLLIAQTPTLSVQEDLKKETITLNKCQDCEQIERKTKKELDGLLTKEIRTKYIKKLSENFRRYKYPKNMYNYLLLKGWGARGMPFNVLYTPNTHQQKILKFVPQKEEKSKIIKEPKKPMPEIYDLVLEREKPLKATTQNTLKKQPLPRKYYSLIPQLFVSYGW